MNITEQFDRLDKLILDHSTDVALMRNILHSIREQCEAYASESASHAEREKKIHELEVANLELQAERDRRESDDSPGFAGSGGFIDRPGG